jgi:hypothetical protein
VGKCLEYVAERTQYISIIEPAALKLAHKRSVSAKSVCSQGGQTINHLDAQRVEMNVPDEFLQVRIFLA